MTTTQTTSPSSLAQSWEEETLSAPPLSGDAPAESQSEAATDRADENAYGDGPSFEEKEEEEGEGEEGEESSSSGSAAFDPVTGKINWDCPCLGGMAYGPCGMQFREAFSCFIFSEQEPKGIDCVEMFKAMQDCFRENPDVYGEGTHAPVTRVSAVSVLVGWLAGWLAGWLSSPHLTIFCFLNRNSER